MVVVPHSRCHRAQLCMRGHRPQILLQSVLGCRISTVRERGEFVDKLVDCLSPFLVESALMLLSIDDRLLSLPEGIM